MTVKPKDVEPINPGWWAKVEKEVYYVALVFALATAVSVLTVATGHYEAVVESDWFLMVLAAVVLTAILILPRGAEAILARRRYGYTRKEYRIAKRRGQGTILTDEEAREKRRERALDRVETIEERVNLMLQELEEMDEIEVEHRIENGRLRVETEDSR